MIKAAAAISVSEALLFIAFAIALAFWLFVMTRLVRRVFAYRRSPK